MMLFFLVSDKKQTKQTREWLNDLYISTHSDVLRYVSALRLDNTFDIEDILQTTYEIALTKADELFNHPNIKGWLLKTSCNLCRQRMAASQQDMHQELELLEDELICFDTDNTDFDLLLKTIYSNITEEEKRLFTLYYIEERTVMEISQQLKVDYTNLRKRYSRLRQKLIVILSK